MKNEEKQRAAVDQEIILGLCKFSIDDVDIALTRGGGKFLVEREYRPMEADGMMAPGEGLISCDREVPKITLNALTILKGADMTKLYPALKSTEVTSPASGVGEKAGDKAGTVITSTDGVVISASDYHTIRIIGKTATGKGIEITIEKAINLENIDWNFAPKDEVIAALTYTGTADKVTKKCVFKVNFLK